eukprot:EG_transcript_8409
MSGPPDAGRTKLGRTTFGNARDNRLITGTDDTLKQSGFYEEDCRRNATRKISWAQRASQTPQGRTAEHELLTAGKLPAPEAAQGAPRCKAVDRTVPLQVLPSERKFDVCKFQTALRVSPTSHAALWRAPEDLPPSAKGKETPRRRAQAGNVVFDVGPGPDSIAQKGAGQRSWDGRPEAPPAAYCLLTLTETGAYLVPVDQWYTFQPRTKSRPASAEEAERSDERYRDRVLSHAQRLIGRPQGEPTAEPATKSPEDVRKKTVRERVDVDDEVGEEEKLQFDDDSDGAVSDASVDRMLATAEDEDADEDEEDEEEDEARREFTRQRKRRGLTEDGTAVQQLLKKQRKATEGDAEDDEEDLTEDEGPAPGPPGALPSAFVEAEPVAPPAAEAVPKPAPKKSRRKEALASKAGAALPASPATAATTLEGQIRAFFRLNGNRKTPVKQLMKHLMKEDAKFQALKGNKEQKEAHFKRMVANTNKVLADIGHKEQQDGELLVWLR